MLENAGFPLYSEREGRHSVGRLEQALREGLPVPLTLPEALALLMSHALRDPGGAGPFGPAVASLVGKIRALLTPRALELVDAMRARVGARTVGAKLQVGAAEHLVEINRALTAQRTLEMRYYSLSSDAETARRVDPYHLTFYQGGLYLVGHCHLRRDVRVFAVEPVEARHNRDRRDALEVGPPEVAESGVSVALPSNVGASALPVWRVPASDFGVVSGRDSAAGFTPVLPADKVRPLTVVLLRFY